MRIRITSPGIYGSSGEVPVGTEFTVKGDMPAGWGGKYEVVKGDAKPDAVPVMNEPGPLDSSVDDLAAYLDGVTDPDEVQRLIDGEIAGKSRKGALAALQSRQDELLA